MNISDREKLFLSATAEYTEKLGMDMAQTLVPGDVLMLSGSLGSGKTVLVKGIASGLGVKGVVTSPTFKIINQYSGRIELYHFDLYRLDSVDQVLDLGYEEYLFGRGVTVIEWADRIRPIWPEKRIEVLMEIVSDTQRRIKVADLRD